VVAFNGRLEHSDISHHCCKLLMCELVIVADSKPKVDSFMLNRKMTHLKTIDKLKMAPTNNQFKDSNATHDEKQATIHNRHRDIMVMFITMARRS
jgi:hypothetical protein